MQPFSYDELRRIQAREKTSPALSPLEGDWAERAAAFVASLRAKLAADYDLATARELENALKILRDIYERRTAKLVGAALRGSRGAEVPVGLGRPEEALFLELVERLRTSEGSFNARLEKPERPAKEASTGKKVRLLTAVPEFIGMDSRRYGPFREKDEVALPPGEAELLVKQKIAIEV